ncbi:unnamed protein product, partial [Phaeothamnion confervicola]
MQRSAVLREALKPARVASLSGLIANLFLIRRYGRSTTEASAVSKTKAAEPRVDGAFLKRMARLLKIMIPSPTSAEAGMLAMVAALLVQRTLFDLVMLRLTTSIERAIVLRDAPAFWRSLASFATYTVSVSCCTGLLKGAQAELALLLRRRLTAHVLDGFMSGITFYGISYLDTRVANVDQRLTQDVELFADSLADVYSDMFKPILDVIIYVHRLSSRVEPAAPATMAAYLLVSGLVLTRLRRPTALHTARVQHEDGAYRFVASRIVANAEEIAFYDGGAKEKGILTSSFDKLVTVIRRSQRFRFSMAVFDNIVAKYFASVVAWTVVARPFLDLGSAKYAGASPSELYQAYGVSGKMMVNLSAALGRLVLSGREMTRLSGFSERVTALLDVIEDCQHGVYVRPSVALAPELPATASNVAVAAAGATMTGAVEPAAAALAAAELERAALKPASAVTAGAALETEEALIKENGDPVAATSSAARRRTASVDADEASAQNAGSSGLGRRSRARGGSGTDGGSSVNGGGSSGDGRRHSVDASPERALEEAAEPSGYNTPVGLSTEASAGRSSSGGGGGSSSPGSGGISIRGFGAAGATVAAATPPVVIERDDVIELEGVPLLTPTGDVLVRSLSFRVESGMNVLVAGPNGSGKSSMFRILGGLWPLPGGRLTRPARRDLYYVAQKPYLVLGTLRDQVIYPWSLEEMRHARLTDRDLENALGLVGLGYLVRGEGGWDAVREWGEVLSGGEKQRVAMSRLFVHSPKFAILDECTSA